MTAPDRAAVDAAVEQVHAWVDGARYDEELIELEAHSLRTVLTELERRGRLLGIDVDREQWDAIAEAEGRHFEGEQTDDTLVGHLAYQRESLRALSHTLQREVKELEAERDEARAELERRIAEREAASRRVGVLRAWLYELGHAPDAVDKRLRRVTAELAARDEKEAGR